MREIGERDTRLMAALFMLGSILVIGGTPENASRSWISLLLSLGLILPLLFLWAWILKVCPDRDLFGIFEDAFGVPGGKFFSALVGVYSFITLSWTLGNYTSFITILTSRDTDKEVPGMLVAAAAALIAGMGFRVLSGASRIFFTVLISALVVTLPLSIVSLDPSAFPLPVFGYNKLGVFEGALSLAMMPFGELIILLAALPPSIKGKRGRGVLVGAAIAFGILFVVFIRNVLMLGERGMDSLYFHSFYALRILSIGSFFQRLEILIAAIYLCCDLLRITVCVFCCGKAVAKCLGTDIQKVAMGPISVGAFAVSEMVLINGQAVFVFRELNKYISLPFCVGIPLLCGIVLLFQKKKRFDGKLPLKSGG